MGTDAPLVYRNNGSGQFEAMPPEPFGGSDDSYVGLYAVPADVNGAVLRQRELFGGGGVIRCRLPEESHGRCRCRLTVAGPARRWARRHRGLDAAQATSPSVGSRSKRGPVGALETARFTPTVHEMTIPGVRLFGFRFTDVLR